MQLCIPFCKTETDKFQKLDNRAFRYILDVPLCTATEFLRGEIGASSAISRDIKTKFIFIKHALQETSNNLLQQIIQIDLEKKITKWANRIQEYMVDTNFTLTRIRALSKDQIKSRINEWDRDKWLNNMQGKSTLARYRDNKTQVQECTWLKNGYQHSLMMRARADVLKLKWRNTDQNTDEICDLCREGRETLEHFLLECDVLQPTRNNYLILQRPRTNNTTEMLMNKILLFEIDEEFPREYYLDIVKALWNKRRRLLDDRENSN